MSRDDSAPSTGRDEERVVPPPAAAPGSATLTADERAVLEALTTDDAGKTVAQLCVRSGLPREQVVAALDGLRSKGMAVRLNTLVKSYVARFPGIEV